MEYKELLHYALKGIGVEIAEIESKIEKGYNLIGRINKGTAETEKSTTEIYEAIGKYQKVVKELQQKKDDLLFDEMMADEEIRTQQREETVIKVALSSILSKDTENLGVLFLDEVAEILNKIALKPYCKRIGKNYYKLTDEDKEIIAEMQLNDYIEAGEQRAREIKEGEYE